MASIPNISWISLSLSPLLSLLSLSSLSIFLICYFLNSREEFEPWPGFEPRTSRSIQITNYWFVFTCQFYSRISATFCESKGRMKKKVYLIHEFLKAQFLHLYNPMFMTIFVIRSGSILKSFVSCHTFGEIFKTCWHLFLPAKRHKSPKYRFHSSVS